MAAGARRILAGLALVLGAGVAGVSCDTGGLLRVEGKGTAKEPLRGHSSTELVNSGTLASNAQYKLFYVLGQPSPLQGVATAPGQRVNGGVTGAVQDK
jgi:hypothetical protein